MRRPNYNEMMKELERISPVALGMEKQRRGPSGQGITAVVCPHCNQQFPIITQIVGVHFKVGVPKAGGGVKQGIPAT